jgi:hypothetical protein
MGGCSSRYRPNQWLIGPDVFPFYERVMRIVLLVIGAIIIAAASLAAMFGDQPAWQVALHAVGNLFLYGLVNAGIVTLIFAILERKGFPADHLRRWSPAELPDVADEQRGKWEGPVEVALTLVFILWWTGVVRWPFGAIGDGFRLEPAPIWAQLFWPVLILASARLVHNLIQWLRPRWKGVRGVFGLATAAGALALLAVVWQAGEWVIVVSTGMPEDGARSLQESLNLALRIAIIVVGIVWTLACLGELWRLVKGARGQAAMA